MADLPSAGSQTGQPPKVPTNLKYCAIPNWKTKSRMPRRPVVSLVPDRGDSRLLLKVLTSILLLHKAMLYHKISQQKLT